MELGGLWWTNVLNLVFPPLRHSPDSQLEYQDPVIHMARKKGRKKERKKRKEERKEKKRKEKKRKIKLLK